MKNFPKASHLSQAGYLYLLLIVLCFVECQKFTQSFQCPQQFGYFRDTTDCNKYYICVFGDALHDKCTPGLFFNNALRMCDWPRNVKDCEIGTLSKSASSSGHRVYGTSTRSPRLSNKNGHRDNNIPSINSIAPTQGTRVGSRYTPPISVMESYAAAIRNVTVHPRPASSLLYRPTTSRPQSTTSSRPYLYSTGPPASFKPVYYRVTNKPTSFSRPMSPSSYEADDYYGSYEDDSQEEPQLMINQHLRSNGRTELYVRPIATPASREENSQARPISAPQGPPRNVRPSVVSFNTRGEPSSKSSSEDNRSSFVRNVVRPAAPTHGSNVRSRAPPVLFPARPSRPAASSLQNLDSNGRDSLDAQFGTNPRTIRLPEGPLDAMRKAERSHSPQQQLEKPRVTSTRYADRNTYKTDDSSQSYDDYPEYYYDDEEYEDDDDSTQNISPVPKVAIRLQKPPSTTTTTTTTRRTTTTTTTTTRKPTTATTKRTATIRPAKRPLPFGISRPSTKSPIKTGPKPLPRLPSRPSPVYTTPRPLVPADKCNSRNCVVPDCRCASAEVPGSLPAREVPQIVLVTFDDAVNDLNFELYAELFEDRRNPNGCPILGTFYVSHEWTDYGMVQSLYSRGHEMASHSITHSHGEKFSVSHWSKEIHGQREILHLYGGVKLEDIRGMRAPFLQVGGNNMFEMLYQTNFTYDSSMPVLDNNPPFYPYTLDYSIGHECMIPPCPTKSYPGLWEVGMVMWNDYRGGRCSMGDACANPDNAEDVFQMLLKNFERHYKSNRAPFGLYYHAAWFVTQHYRRGYMKFIEYINSKDDVYIVTTWQALQWMRDPTPLSRIKSFKPWQCPKDPEKPGPCHHPTSCNLNYKGGGSRNLKTCQPCPSTFPWTGRTGFDEVYAL